jgi:hypothetical protein
MTTKLRIKQFLIITLIFSGVFMIDFILPVSSSNQTVTAIVRYKQRGFKPLSSTNDKFGIKTINDDIPVGVELYNATNKGDKIVINKTRILRIVKTVENGQLVYEPISVYKYFCIMPLSVLISSLSTFWTLRKGGDEYFSPLAINIVTFLSLLCAYIFNHFI